MHAMAQCCITHGPDSPPQHGPVPKLLLADLFLLLLLLLFIVSNLSQKLIYECLQNL